MKKLLYKEMRLSASLLSYFFIAGAFLTFVPGYPILLGAFFTTLGIFYSFQTMRENNDIRYSMLIPVSKSEIVRGKFAFTVTIEALSFAIMAIITIIRMVFLKDAAVYTSNALMCANLSFLGFALFIFGLFNSVFVGGFFKTAYYFGKPFVIYCIVSFLVIGIAETLPHIFPDFNSFGFENLTLQLAALFAGLLLFVLLTLLSLRRSERAFEETDL